MAVLDASALWQVPPDPKPGEQPPSGPNPPPPPVGDPEIDDPGSQPPPVQDPGVGEPDTTPGDPPAIF